jgi:hypothetical protein
MYCGSALDLTGMMLIQQKSSWIENAAGLQSLVSSSGAWSGAADTAVPTQKFV